MTLRGQQCPSVPGGPSPPSALPGQIHLYGEKRCPGPSVVSAAAGHPVTVLRRARICSRCLPAVTDSRSPGTRFFLWGLSPAHHTALPAPSPSPGPSRPCPPRLPRGPGEQKVPLCPPGRPAGSSSASGAPPPAGASSAPCPAERRRRDRDPRDAPAPRERVMVPCCD